MKNRSGALSEKLSSGVLDEVKIDKSKSKTETCSLERLFIIELLNRISRDTGYQISAKTEFQLP